MRGLHEADRARIVVFAGSEDRERLDEIERALPPAVAIAPFVPIRVFGALLARCSAVITPDSGPMHLAAAVGTPTVTLVRTQQSTFYLPRESQHCALYHAEGVSVRSVLMAVHSILEGAPSA